jgi:hypothetical protein
MKGTHPGKLVMLGSLGLDTTSIMFHAHPPKRVLEHHQSILPCSDGSFPAFQLSLSWARSYSHSSTATTGVTTMPEEEEGLHQSRSRDQHHDKNQVRNYQHRVKPHSTNDKARPGAAVVLARWDDG